MAKKIKLDFSKVEERSGWNTRQVPEGLYKATITVVQETEAQDGTAMLVYGFRLDDSRYKSRHFPYYCKQQQNQLWKLRDLLVAAGETIPKRAVQIDPGKIVGKSVAVEIADDMYNDTVRSSVSGVYGLDILDEDSTGSAPEEDEEEYDDEPEEDEDFEEEGDDEDEDFDDDLDEEDLDDEDDFDDEEDEEPEEAPAPKRRAAPARKAPAKAAPAKRTVRRR